MPKIVLYTLDARDHVMLEVARDYFGISPERMRREILGMLRGTVDLLASKGIRYADLKPALIPSIDRREAAFIFDSTEINESFYGLPVQKAILPLFSKTSTHSILVGDYIGGNHDQEMLLEAFEEAVTLSRSITWKHSTLFYIVYINNLSKKMTSDFDKSLKSFPAYVGYADLTFASKFKLLLSTKLVRRYIKHRNIILMGHEDDRDDSKNVNIAGYPFEDFGYQIRSIPSTNYGVILGYKIERPVFEGFQTDTEFSINAISTTPLPLDSLKIEVDDRKFGYLEKEKAGSLKRAGLLKKGCAGLKELIRQKLSSNYIYSMTYDDEHDTSSFNIIIEVHPPDGDPQRLLAAFEYKAFEQSLRLITMF